MFHRMLNRFIKHKHDFLLALVIAIVATAETIVDLIWQYTWVVS